MDVKVNVPHLRVAVPEGSTKSFHDHARIEQMLFDGAIAPSGGVLRPDLGRPGLGIELKTRDAQRYAM